MAVVLVGAMIVASIETVWAGLVTPPKRELKTFRYDEAARVPIHLEKGAELGRFKLGSTAIVLFGPFGRTSTRPASLIAKYPAPQWRIP